MCNYISQVKLYQINSYISIYWLASELYMGDLDVNNGKNCPTIRHYTA